MSTSPYYKDTGRISLASNISMRFRKRMFHKFMDVMRPRPESKVLDIGVTSDDVYQESNYFEKMYPYPEQIVCVGTEDGGYLEEKYKGLKFYKVNPSELLPFNDKEFDVAFSNAVIEHVGSFEEQKKFVREMSRVSKSFFITTPNRWFPVEFHTAIPLLHFLPPEMYRKVLSAIGEKYWSMEENLNLLSRKDLKCLFEDQPDIIVDNVSLFGVPTNLIVYNKPVEVNTKI